MQLIGYLWSEGTEKRLFLHPHGKVGLEVSGYGIRSEVQRQPGQFGLGGIEQTFLPTWPEQGLKNGVFCVPF